MEDEYTVVEDETLGTLAIIVDDLEARIAVLRLERDALKAQQESLRKETYHVQAASETVTRKLSKLEVALKGIKEGHHALKPRSRQ